MSKTVTYPTRSLDKEHYLSCCKATSNICYNNNFICCTDSISSTIKNHHTWAPYHISLFELMN